MWYMYIQHVAQCKKWSLLIRAAVRFLATPQSTNAVIGTQALFNCTASEVVAITWLVDEKSVQGSEFIDSGINAVLAILGPPDVRESILTIMVDAEFDNATVQCIVIESMVFKNHPSEIATLTVKGTYTFNEQHEHIVYCLDGVI